MSIDRSESGERQQLSEFDLEHILCWESNVSLDVENKVCKISIESAEIHWHPFPVYENVEVTITGWWLLKLEAYRRGGCLMPGVRVDVPELTGQQFGEISGIGIKKDRVGFCVDLENLDHTYLSLLFKGCSWTAEGDWFGQYNADD